jgi:hypothetical protein
MKNTACLVKEGGFSVLFIAVRGSGEDPYVLIKSEPQTADTLPSEGNIIVLLHYTPWHSAELLTMLHARIRGVRY